MNVYSNPEKFGLELVQEVPWERGYEFDLSVIWRNPATGVWYWGRSAGCSCASPFEGYGVNGLESAPWPQAFFKFEKHLKERLEVWRTYSYPWNQDELGQMVAKALERVHAVGSAQ